MIERVPVTIKVTTDMHQDAAAAAKRGDRTLADWIRHCISFGVDHQEVIDKTRCKPNYQVLAHGRPSTSS